MQNSTQTSKTSPNTQGESNQPLHLDQEYNHPTSAPNQGELKVDSARTHRLNQGASGGEQAGTANSPNLVEAKRSPPTRRSDKLPPRSAHKLMKLGVLRILNRYRMVRAIDVAALYYPDESLKNALSASQRFIGKLRSSGLVRRYKSEGHLTYYAMTAKGARWLRDNGDGRSTTRDSAGTKVKRRKRLSLGDGDAAGTTSLVGLKRNPEHELWTNTLAHFCAARGFKAWTDKEISELMGWKVEDRKAFFQTEVEKKIYIRQTGQIKAVMEVVFKGLLPDLLAVGDGTTWIEIDRSARGEDRLNDLATLVKRIGWVIPGLQAKVSNHSTLNRVVVLCKSETILRKNLNFLTGKIQEDNGHGRPRLMALAIQQSDDNKPMLVPVNGIPNAFEVWDYVKRPKKLTVYERVGWLNLQLLPVWLPAYTYRGSKVETAQGIQYKPSRTDGWFQDDAYPWQLPPGVNFPKPTSPLIRR